MQKEIGAVLAWLKSEQEAIHWHGADLICHTAVVVGDTQTLKINNPGQRKSENALQDCQFQVSFSENAKVGGETVGPEVRTKTGDPFWRLTFNCQATPYVWFQ